MSTISGASEVSPLGSNPAATQSTTTMRERPRDLSTGFTHSRLPAGANSERDPDALDVPTLANTEVAISKGLRAVCQPQESTETSRSPSADSPWTAEKGNSPSLLTWLKERTLTRKGSGRHLDRFKSRSLYSLTDRLDGPVIEEDEEISKSIKKLREISDIGIGFEAAERLIATLPSRTVQTLLEHVPLIVSSDDLTTQELDWISLRWNAALDFPEAPSKPQRVLGLDDEARLLIEQGGLGAPDQDGSRLQSMKSLMMELGRHKLYLQSEQNQFNPANMSIVDYQGLRNYFASLSIPAMDSLDKPAETGPPEDPHATSFCREDD